MYFLLYFSCTTVIVSWKTSLVRPCNLHILAVGRDIGTETTTVKDENREISTDLNELHANIVFRNVFGLEPFGQPDSMFPFVRSFVDRVAGAVQSHLVSHVHRKLSRFRHILYSTNMEHVSIRSFWTQFSKIFKFVNICWRTQATSIFQQAYQLWTLNCLTRL